MLHIYLFRLTLTLRTIKCGVVRIFLKKKIKLNEFDKISLMLLYKQLYFVKTRLVYLKLVLTETNEIV